MSAPQESGRALFRTPIVALPRARLERGPASLRDGLGLTRWPRVGGASPEQLSLLRTYADTLSRVRSHHFPGSLSHVGQSLAVGDQIRESFGYPVGIVERNQYSTVVRQKFSRMPIRCEITGFQARKRTQGFPLVTCPSLRCGVKYRSADAINRRSSSPLTKRFTN